MTPMVRWLALLPDPVTGRYHPMRNSAGGHWELMAADKPTAQRKALRLGVPAVAEIISALEWEARRREPKRQPVKAITSGRRLGQPNPQKTVACLCGHRLTTGAWRKRCPQCGALLVVAHVPATTPEGR